MEYGGDVRELEKKRGEKQGLRFERRGGKEKKIKVKKPFPSGR